MTTAMSKPAHASESSRLRGGPHKPRLRRPRGQHSLLAHGEPMVWLAGGGLAVALLMIIGLLTLVFVQGIFTFWPVPVVMIETHAGEAYMGEVTRDDHYRPAENVLDYLPEAIVSQARVEVEAADGWAHRRLVRIGNYELTNEHFVWVSDFQSKSEVTPPWAMVLERLSWGRFYGEPKLFLIDGQVVAESPEAIWARFRAEHPKARQRWSERRHLEKHEIGKINHAKERARLRLRSLEIEADRAALRDGDGSPRHAAARAKVEQARIGFEEAERTANRKFAEVRERIAALNDENARYQLVLATAAGQDKSMALSDIVRAYLPNQIGVGGKLGIYLSRWKEFLLEDPREANMEGGVFPAIFGTVVMTLVMSLAVVPFGVLAALYLREYATAGPLISAVRIAVNNLAGVPSIVFGVFGLGFFCYLVGGSIDQLFFEAKLPSPTFGTGGLMWAAFTLALLTLPVIIVSTEEALAAVPRSMRDGSYACGASKWQTIQRIVLPRAMPGIMTGMILAMARGAGEVAPLMLVGAVKLAPELPIDGHFPFVHMERSFMHLGFHIYDLGFQSQNSEAAKPMVFTTTLLLIVLIATLNLSAIWLRGRLRRKFVANQF